MAKGPGELKFRGLKIKRLYQSCNFFFMSGTESVFFIVCLCIAVEDPVIKLEAPRSL